MAFLVRLKRVKWARNLLIKHTRKITPNDLLELAYECGLSECMSFDEDGQVAYEFTDMQMVAFAAAVYALVEVRDDV